MHHIAGLYRHQPSGKYRVLWVSTPRYFDRADTSYTTFYYVVAVGSSDIRCIAEGKIAQTTPMETALCKGLPDSSGCPPVHHRGSLHWGFPGRSIMVFNTAAETFRLMGRPVQLRFHQLLEMDGTLALCSVSPEQMTVDVWVVQDYGAETTETWSFKHQINLSGVDDPIPRSWVMRFPRMVVLNNGELLIQFIRGCGPVLHCDIDGKFLGYVKSKDGQVIGLWITKHYLQESLIPLPPFHEMREDDSATQGPPFFVGL
uniref:F-box associated domain-containing protein n=1 Tax=Aegilops tauschii subsp. strangulata TaxID=200361 RepID=A0A453LAR5_AEGTS